MSFAVIGSGVIGLTTALELKREFPNAEVSIFSDKFNEDTTSYVAAGVFRPGASFMGTSIDVTRKWVSDAFQYWHELCQTEDAPLAGICSMSAYIFSKTHESIVRNHFLEKLLPVYRRATERELELCNGGWKYGSFFTTTLTECKLFLPYAAKKFENMGGKIVTRRIKSLNDLGGQKYDVILNCTGLGAKELCNDHSLVPIRGQVIKVKAPWIKVGFYGDYDTYIIPGFEGVTLGGCRQYDSYNEEVCPYDTMSIRERCCKMLPSLEKAEVLRIAVGLRPHRTPVRVENEILEDPVNGRPLRIVHNYGHGGYGVTTAPGTAKFSVKLVREILSTSQKLSKVFSKSMRH